MQMKITRGRLIQVFSVFIIHIITLFFLQRFLSGFNADSLRSLMVFTIFLAVAQTAFWWVFINLLSWLPVWLYPILTFILNGFFIFLVGNQVRGSRLHMPPVFGLSCGDGSRRGRRGHLVA
jgi:hypothetical protein